MRIEHADCLAFVSNRLNQERLIAASERPCHVFVLLAVFVVLTGLVGLALVFLPGVAAAGAALGGPRPEVGRASSEGCGSSSVFARPTMTLAIR